MTTKVKMLHLSFKGDLPLTLRPQLPAGTELNQAGLYPEPDQPRVSFAPTVLQCFQAIYPNVSHFFEIRKFPYMDFFLYEAADDTNIGVVTNAELVSRRYVWDAHVTGEMWATKPVRVNKVGKVRVYNTNKCPMLETHPFNDIDLPLQGVGPKDIDLKITYLSGSSRWANGESKK